MDPMEEATLAAVDAPAVSAEFDEFQARTRALRSEYNTFDTAASRARDQLHSRLTEVRRPRTRAQHPPHPVCVRHWNPHIAASFINLLVGCDRLCVSSSPERPQPIPQPVPQHGLPPIPPPHASHAASHACRPGPPPWHQTASGGAPAGAPAAAADRTQRPDATCEAKNGRLSGAP